MKMMEGRYEQDPKGKKGKKIIKQTNMLIIIGKRVGREQQHETNDVWED
jgi:hypothetical protein